MQRAFEVKYTTFFLVWQVLTYRLKNQTSKNVADTTFKEVYSLKVYKGQNDYM